MLSGRSREPYHAEGGLAILFGSLAPDGAVVKQSGVDPSMLKFTGRARVFDGEDAAFHAIVAGAISLGTWS